MGPRRGGWACAWLVVVGLVVAGPCWAQDLPVPPDAGAGRSAVAGLEVAPELGAVLTQVLAQEAYLDELSRPLQEDGAVAETPAAYEERLFGEGSELLVFLRAGYANFDTYGKPMPEPRVCADLVRYGAGYRAAQELVAARPGLEPGELLALFTTTFVHGDPLWTSPEALEYHASELQAGWLAPLGNGGALGYLTWGLLYQDDYWQVEARDREGFVMQLLARGFESRLVARVVRRALEPPMVPARLGAPYESFGRTIAGTLVPLRGRVGFTKAHEDLLVRDLEALEQLEEGLGPEGGELLVDKRLARDGLGRRTVESTPQGHLRTWLPEMLRLVRQELYRGGAPELMRRGGTLKERLLYWSKLFGEQGFVAGREAMLAEVASILAGDDDHPLTPEIERLLALQAAVGLSAIDASRLESLVGKRQQERDDLIRSMSQLLGRSGAGEHYGLLVETLAVDLAGLLAELDPARQRSMTELAWSGPFLLGQPRAVETLGSLLAGELELPDWTKGSLILDLGAHPDYPGGPGLLGTLVREGELEDLHAAIANSKWMSAEDLEIAGERLFEALGDPGASRLNRNMAGPSYLSALSRFGDTELAKAKLLETFSKGYWSDSVGEGAFGLRLSPWHRTWLKRVLTSGEIEALIAAGELPTGVL